MIETLILAFLCFFLGGYNLISNLTTQINGKKIAFWKWFLVIFESILLFSIGVVAFMYIIKSHP